MSIAGSPRTARISWPFLIVPLLAFTALACWAVSSPVGSSPDDDFHHVSIWCAQGERDGLCEYTESANERLVPAALVATKCYAHKPNATGKCGTDALTDPLHALTRTERGNFGTESGLYPPLYYTAMSVFASQNITWSVITIRLVNSFAYVAMMTALCALLPAHRRPTLITASAVTMIPVGAFLLASANPSSWALIAGCTVPLAVVGYFETEGRRRQGLAALALLATLMGGGARSDAALYVILTIIAAIILFARRERSFWVSALWPLALALLSSYFVLSTQQSASALATTSGSGSGGLLLDNLLALPVMWAGALGAPSPIEQWGLGWLDTSMPAIVWMAMLLVCATAVLGGVASATGRKLFVVSAAFAALWVIPLYIIQSWGVHTGQWVQPRYILPLLTIFVTFALLRAPGGPGSTGTGNGLRGVGNGSGRNIGGEIGGDLARPLPFTRNQRHICAVAIVAANSVALFINMRRYTHGADSQAINLGHNASWWWEGSIPAPMTIWAAGTLAFTLVIAIVAWRFAHPAIHSPNRGESLVIPFSTPNSASVVQ
ncbi:MAG: DUF2142 domain-containing protein [Ancrocorticia sp.]